METSQPTVVQTEETPKVPAKRPKGAVSQVFGHFTRKEFWIDLMEMIVKNAATAFFIALGKTLVEYGKKRGGANPGDLDFFDAKPTPAQSPAATAFSRGYTPSSEYRSLSYPPATRPEETFPGFPSR